jgi:hypothetical protein
MDRSVKARAKLDWLPTGELGVTVALRPAGITWDAVRVAEPLWERTLAVLDEQQAVHPAAVLMDLVPRVPRAAWWLVPPGTAAEWDVPGTRALGVAAHLTVCTRWRTQPPGPYWLRPPRDGQWLIDPDELAAAVRAAHDLAAPAVGS